MLNSISFENYKAFEERQQLELRPLTLLFGHNSVGKSAALRLLPILASAAANRTEPLTVPSVFEYGARALRGARFNDLVFDGQVGKPISFGLIWDGASYEFDVRLGDDVDGEFISEFDLQVGATKLSGVLGGSRGDRVYELYADDGKQCGTGMANGIRLAAQAWTEQRYPQAMEALEQFLDAFSASVHWIGATRAPPPRLYSFGPGSSYRIWPDGTGTAAALRASYLAQDGVTDAVSKWMKSACDCELSFAETDKQVVNGQALYSLRVKVAKNETAISIQDVGEGVAQALPVVTLCHQGLAGTLGDAPILAFEQPELHLHPRAAVALSEEIADCVAKGSTARHVIETHSESVLLSVQSAIVQGKLKPDDVVVYWVSQEEGRASLRRISFDSDGYPSNGWPAGVFREVLEQARQLATLRKD